MGWAIAGRTKDGATFIACGRGSPPGKRSLCDTPGCSNPHRKLCDFPVPDPKNPSTTGMKTCDKKMCLKCTHNVGPDKDFCPPHYIESLKGDPHGT